MIHFDIITIQPGLLESPFQHSILKRGIEKGLISIHVEDLRPYGLGKHKQVDDYQYGGGAGMVMMCEPMMNCIEHLQEGKTYDEVIFLTPDGSRLNQKMANKLSLSKNLLLICGHYKGLDERIRENIVTMEISIGDYVLSGGELAAAVLVDSIGRLIPGVLNDETSALTDSFQDDLLAPPVYTRPSEFRGWNIPDILLSGDDAKIDNWRYDQQLQRTKDRRPDLLENEDAG
jgi:tRNA (guanine37-N1)-methyltransferase